MVTEFFKTLFKGTKYEKEASCVVGRIVEVNVPMKSNGNPDLRRIGLEFDIEDKGNLDFLFKREQKDILSMLNERQKRYKLTIKMEEVDGDIRSF